MKIAILRFGLDHPEGFFSGQLQREFGINKQSAYRYLKSLEHNRLIRCKSRGKPNFYGITEEGTKALKEPKVTVSSGSTRTVENPLRTVHKLCFKAPVIVDRGLLQPDKVNDKMNHWVAKHKHIEGLPFAVSLMFSNKSVVVTLSPNGLKVDPWNLREDLRNYTLSALLVVKEYLRNQGIEIGDLWKQTDQHMDNEAGEYTGEVDPNVGVKVPRRPVGVSGPVGKLARKARLWFDESPGVLTIETDCLSAEEKILLMGEMTAEIYRHSPAFERISAMMPAYIASNREIAGAIQTLNVSLRENQEDRAIRNRPVYHLFT